MQMDPRARSAEETPRSYGRCGIASGGQHRPVRVGAIRCIESPRSPSLKVQRGRVSRRVQFRGEMKAQRSITISAPPDVGSLQIVKIAADGSAGKNRAM